MSNLPHRVYSINFNDDDFKTSSLTHIIPPRKTKCVKVAMKKDGVAVRDSKDQSNLTLVFTKDEWEAFIGGVKKGEFDL